MPIFPSIRSLLPLTFLALSGATASVHGADLLTIYKDAQSYDAQFASAQASQAAGREAMTQGRAGLLPTVALTANRMNNDVRFDVRNNSALDVKKRYDSDGWSVNLSQPLFRWDRWAAYNQSEARVAASEAQFELARMDLILRVTQSYFDVLQAAETVSAATANKKAIAEQLEEAKRAFEVGTKTVVEVHDAQARFDLSSAQEIVARNDLNVKRQQLRLLTGKDYDGFKDLKSGASLPRPDPDNIDKWVSSAEQGYFGVQAAQAQLTVADEEVSKQRGGHMPSVDLVASRSNAGQDFNSIIPGGSGTDTKTTVVGVQLTLPLFAGGAVSSAVDQAVALKSKAQADLDYARRTAALQARQAYLGVVSGLAQVTALEAALVSSQSALDSNKLGFEVGVRTNIEVLNAQSQYYSTRQNLVKARLDTLSALLKLKTAAGTLNDGDVSAVNALLD